MSFISLSASTALCVVLAYTVCAASARAQLPTSRSTPDDTKRERVDSAASSLDSLVNTALAVSPVIAGAAARVRAAHARIAPAGGRPDPILMAGILNLPVHQPGFSDFMTMKMIGISQSLPYPGKLGLRTRAASEDARATDLALDEKRLDVMLEVRSAYYDLAFLDRSMEIVSRNQATLGSLARVAQTQYTSGSGSQAELLRIQIERSRLSDQATVLTEARGASLARLNAALDRQSDIPISPPSIPAYITRAAVLDSAAPMHFTSTAFGARTQNSPLLPLDSLEALAIRNNPALQAHEAEIRAQAARAELARKATRPDFDVSLQYGQRQGNSDMLSGIVSIPLPLQRGRKQDAEVAGARADLDALEAEHRASVAALRAEIARSVSELERSRTQLALSTKVIIPQARAALATASASYQVSRAEFSTVIDAQASLFEIETAYWRSLTDFAKALAELQHTVGAEVLR